MSAPSQTPVQPFPGLRPFAESEVDLFFGREGQIAEIVAALARHRFAAVLGNSGSGKSSLVTAGVLPGLRAGLLAEAGERWIFVNMRPGNDPVGALLVGLQAAGLCRDANHDDLRSDPLGVLRRIRTTFEHDRSKRANVLILADQFEELFRYTARPDSTVADHDEKAAFVCLLLTTVSHELALEPGATVYGAITMRSDYLGECAQFRLLAETMNRAQYLVPRMTRDQLRQTIEGPIGMSGGRISPLLVQRLLNDAGEDPDQLPLLQHALMRTWQHWFDRSQWQTEISEDDYLQIGAIQSALSRHANEACNDAVKAAGSLTPVMRIFQRLRERDDKGRETRRPTSVKELCSVSDTTLDQASAIIDCFRGTGRTFLTPFEGPLLEETLVDVTHECLLRKWDRLSTEWADEEEESRHVYLQLATRNPDDYLQGAMLIRTLEWWNKRQPNRDWASRYHPGFEQAEALLKASEKRHDDEVDAQDRERKEQEKRRVDDALAAVRIQQNVSRKRAAYILAAAALVIAGLAVYGYFQLREKSKIAAAQLLESRAAMAAQSDGLLRVSALLAAESYLHDPNEEALSTLANALSILPKLTGGLPGIALKTTPMAAYSNDGKMIAAASGADVLLLDTASGTLDRTLHHTANVEVLQFAGDRLVTLTADAKVSSWPWKTSAPPASFSCGGIARAISSTPDGLTIACAAAQAPDGKPGPVVTVWARDPKSGAVRSWSPTLAKDVTDIADVALSANGALLAVAEGSQLLVYDVFRNALRDWGPADGKVVLASPSPQDESGFYFADETGGVRVWSQNTTSPVLKLSSTPSALTASTNLLAVAGSDGVVKVWDTQAGAEQARAIIDGAALTLSIAPDETELLVIQADEIPKRYTLNANVAIPVSLVRAARFSPDGTFAVLTGDDYAVVDVKNRRTIDQPAGAPRPMAFSADNRRIVAGPPSGPWRVLKYANGLPGDPICVLDLPAAAAAPSGLRFSPDGRFLAAYVSAAKGAEKLAPGIRVWDSADGKLAAHLDFQATSPPFTFTPDSTAILLAHGGKVKKLEIAANTTAELSGGDPNASQLSFSPAGDLFAMAIASRAHPAEARGDKKTPQQPERGSVTLWRWPSMQAMRTLAHPGAVPMVAFSADGATLATICSDRTVSMWNLANGQIVCRFHPGWPIFALAMMPDGSVASASNQGVSISKWRFEGLRSELCKRVGGPLTKEQWAEYVPGEKYHDTCAEQ
jgi:WD40 repeat protein